MPLTFPTYDPTDLGNQPGDGPLRVGGQSLKRLPVSDKSNRPDALSKSAEKQQDALVLVRDCSEGNKKIKAEQTKYLPKAFGENSRNYDVRLNRSVFYNVFGRTVDGLVGQVFRRDPKLSDDVPPQIAGTETEDGHWANIDNAGTDGDAFLREILQDALTAGHAAILVDYPNTGGQVLTLADEKGLRPYWIAIKKENMLSWRTEVIDGKTVLAQIVLRECQMIPDGMFGEKEQTRYRALYREPGGVCGFQLLELSENKKEVILVDEGIYGNQDEIPLAEITTSGSTGIFESDPPLIDLAYMNVAHYQQLSDYFNSIYKSNVPILTRIGVDNGTGDTAPVTVGADNLMDLPIGASLQYTSHDGAALAQSKASLDDLKADMGTLGLSMLSPQKRTAETAQAKRMDKSTEDSGLAVTATGVEKGAAKALSIHAKYLKLDKGGKITMNKEFEQQQMQADMLGAWTNAVASAGIPARFMVKAMQVGELIEADEDSDDIALEMEAAAQAKADAEAQALQDRATMANSAKQKPPVQAAA